MMKRLFFSFVCGMTLLGAVSCVSAPTAEQMRTPEALQEQRETAERLLAMLPQAQRTLPKAQEEAQWLATTLHRSAAAIARLNHPVLTCGLHNRMVNSSFRLRQRGLCWHYQHDMYRELRRRPLTFFRIGCCVLDKGKGSEHHCLYLCEKEHGTWQTGFVICAWRYSGRLKFYDEETLTKRQCQDLPDVVHYLNTVYAEGHRLPMEHWARVRTDAGGMRDYVNSDTPEGKASIQGRLMRENCLRGMQKRQGKEFDYE